VGKQRGIHAHEMGDGRTPRRKVDVHRQVSQPLWPNGAVTQFDPPRVLEYTWFASWHTDPLHETIVRWELAPAIGGTQVKVTHSGLAPMPEDCTGYAQGWPGLVTRIKQFVESNLK
jgi:uncharacterized protein YndB with AHSA1/START domain